MRREQSRIKGGSTRKIAILLPNTCNPDYRIIKYAHLFSIQGNDVKVFCGRDENLPEHEFIEAVEYVRQPIVPRLIKSALVAKTEGVPSGSVQVHTSSHEPAVSRALLLQSRVILRRAAAYGRKGLRRVARVLLKPIKGVAFNINRHFAYKYQPLVYARAFEGMIVDWCPDIIQCHDWQTLELGVKLKKIIGCTLIFDSHELEVHRNPPLPYSRKMWMSRYEARLLPQCDLVTTVCDSIAIHLREQYGVSTPMVIVNAPIYNNALQPPVVSRWGRIPVLSDVRKEAGVPDSCYLMVVVGNLTINRGIETILEAMRILPDDISVAMVGKVNKEFRGVIDSLVAKYGLSSRVHLIDPVNPVCLVDFLSAADLGLVPIIPATLSYEFALPNKLFECVFANLPVVVSNTRELEGIVRKYQLGRSFASGDACQLAATVIEQRRSADRELQVLISKRFIAENNFEGSTAALISMIGRGI